MNRDKETFEQEEIFSKSLKAGRRTYFFDVRPTKAGDYYLTITESKKFTQDFGNVEYKKHKIFLYKEDFKGFKDTLDEVVGFILKEKGEDVISERHHNEFAEETSKQEHSRFTNVSFEDI